MEPGLLSTLLKVSLADKLPGPFQMFPQSAPSHLILNNWIYSLATNQNSRSSLQWPKTDVSRKAMFCDLLRVWLIFKEIGSFPGSSQRPEHFLLKTLQKVFRSMMGAWTRPLRSFQSEIGVTCGQLHSPTVMHVFKEKVEVMNIELGSRGPFPAQQLPEARQVMFL